MPVAEFEAAIALRSAGAGAGGRVPQRDEVECLIANMIYKVCVRPVFLLVFFSWVACVRVGLELTGTRWRCRTLGLYQGIHTPRASAGRLLEEE